MSKKIIILGTVLFLVLSLFSQDVYASCSKNILSVEEAFIKSDIVFKGVFKESQESDYTFQIEELYKAPNQLFKNKKEITVRSNGFDGINFSNSRGVEWVIYGAYKKLENIDVVLTSSCAKTQPLPSDYILHIKENNKTLSDFVFVGELLKAEHFGYDERRNSGRSKLTFKIDDLIKNETKQPNFENVKEAMINVMSCGELFKLGHNYVISADLKTVPIKNKEGGFAKKFELYMHCTPRAPIGLNLVSRLRSLSKSYNLKQESNKNGNNYNE